MKRFIGLFHLAVLIAVWNTSLHTTGPTFIALKTVQAIGKLPLPNYPHFYAACTQAVRQSAFNNGDISSIYALRAQQALERSTQHPLYNQWYEYYMFCMRGIEQMNENDSIFFEHVCEKPELVDRAVRGTMRIQSTNAYHLSKHLSHLYYCITMGLPTRPVQTETPQEPVDPHITVIPRTKRSLLIQHNKKPV